MYSITLNGRTHKAELSLKQGDFAGTFDGAAVNGNLLKVSDNQYHLLHNNRSYNVQVLRVSAEDKSIVLRVNSSKFTLHVKDKYDELLHSLGLDTLASRKINEIKAPMPGMVLKILVKEGDVVKKGDPLVVLEAMKMENILKSPADGTVKKIAVNTGTAVEKNQLLIQF